MESKVRVGVIGTSPFAEWMHLSPLASHPDAEITAICGRSRGRAEEVARRFGIPKVYSDARELIHSAVDAVVIVTPDDLHYPLTMQALGAGKHVFCEKALAMNQAQAREMYETAEAKKRIHMTLFTFRVHPAFAQMRALVGEGYAGKLFQGQLSYLLSLGRNTAYQWRADSRHSNGMVADLGSHLVDLARLIFGEVRAVAARNVFYNPRTLPDGGRLDQNNDSAVLLLEFVSGAQATFQVSALAHQGDSYQRIRVEANGSGGTLALDWPVRGGPLLVGAREEDQPLLPVAIPEALWRGADPALDPPARFDRFYHIAPVGERLFIDSILSNTQPSPSFYDGWKAQQVIDAALEASRTRQWVEVKE
ncbi:MAG: Gfo/Idh/MocA family oxidoreductase [Anaerolineaceae bacterium]|nr:Gfo/Idh/MocA family oxidoreductase [Anaerolineaceae bacterium]